MVIDKIVGIVVSVALTYLLRSVIGWPWYATVFLAIFTFVMVRYIFQSFMKFKTRKL